nr:kirola-like [Ipomoea batatas]
MLRIFNWQETAPMTFLQQIGSSEKRAIEERVTLRRVKSTLKAGESEDGEVSEVQRTRWSLSSWHKAQCDDDGKTKTAEEVIEAIDEKEKLVKFKVIGGEILEDYKSFIITCEVHTDGDNHLVTWTIEYEKVKEEIPEPLSYLDFLLDITKDMEDHHANLKP